MENANVDVFHRIHVFMSEDKKFSSQQDFMSEVKSGFLNGRNLLWILKLIEMGGY